MTEPRFLIQIRKNQIMQLQKPDVPLSTVQDIIFVFLQDKTNWWFKDTQTLMSELHNLPLGTVIRVAANNESSSDILVTKTYDDSASAIKISEPKSPIRRGIVEVPLPLSDDEESNCIEEKNKMINTPTREDKEKNKLYLEYKVFCIRNLDTWIRWLANKWEEYKRHTMQ